MLSGEIFSPTRLLLQYMKALTKSEKLKAFMAPKMTDLITFIDTNKKYTEYNGGDIHGIYRYLEIIGAINGFSFSLFVNAFRNGEQLEDFHSRILRLQQEIMLSGEIVYPTRIILQYMKALTNSEKLKAFMAPK